MGCPANLANASEYLYQLVVIIFLVFCVFPEKPDYPAARTATAGEDPEEICTKFFKGVVFFLDVDYNDVVVW